MTREALLRELRKLARKAGVHFYINAERGKGAHYLVEYGEKRTTIQSGELSPAKVRTIKDQLGIK